jgi:pilus assembly protein CpaB
VAYGLQDGDHVNVIATLLISDLDTSFQTLLPNWTATVTSPFVYTETGEAQLTAEISAGGNGSSVGRYEFEPNMGQPLYIVPSEPQRPRLVSQTLLQDVIVLHVGDFPLKQTETQPAQQEAGAGAVPTPIPPPGQAPATQTTIEEPPTPPDIITLVVTPQDAVTLNYLLYSGAQLSLALRPAGDDTRVQTESVTLQFLFNGYNFAVPEKLPYGMEPRIDVLKPPVLANDIPAE